MGQHGEGARCRRRRRGKPPGPRDQALLAARPRPREMCRLVPHQRTLFRQASPGGQVNGTTRQPATGTATVPAPQQPPLDIQPALPGIRPATGQRTAGAKPRAGRPATAEAVSAKPPDPTAAAAKAAGAAADGGADDEVPRWAAKALEQLLHVTCWLDPGEDGERLTATVRFTGQRTDVTGKPGPGDTFTQEETYQGIVPGSGPVAVTAEVRGVNPGTWSVTARPVSRAVVGQSRPAAAPEPAAAGPGAVAAAGDRAGRTEHYRAHRQHAALEGARGHQVRLRVPGRARRAHRPGHRRGAAGHRPLSGAPA